MKRITDPRVLIVVHEGERAWRSAFAVSLLVGVAEVGFALIDFRIFPDLLLPLLRCAHAILCAGCVALLMSRKGSPTVRLGNMVFALVALPFFVIFWIAETKMAGLGKPWIPFIGHKLVMMGLALMAPASFWLSAGLIAGLTLESVALWFTFEEHVRAMQGLWEPWVTLIIGGIGGALLVYRSRSLDVERRFSRARTRAENLQRLARLFLAVRDQTNTPLQTIEIASVLLRSRYPDAAQTLDRIDGAVTQLKELSQLLSGFEDLLLWKQGDDSIDAQTLFHMIQHAGAEETPPPPPRRKV